MTLDTLCHDTIDGDLHWLCLLDQLYAMVETEGAEAALAGPLDDWPALWQPLVREWAVRIGACSVQISERASLQSPGCDAGFLSHRRITGQVIWARSVSAEGFNAAQAREFHVFCSHLHTAWALRSALDATQASLASLYGVIDALPAGIVVLDAHGEAVLLNRQSREGQLPEPGERVHLREIAAPPALLAQQMQARYALTDRELLLAWNLAQGLSLKHYAAHSGRSLETVRAQLKSVFRKLGAADQKHIGLIVFDALHAITLQALGAGLATLPEHAATSIPQPAAQHLPWP
ncbi:MAG: hypothetical protein ABW190_04805 [Rhizobacter sp.]